jgi:hypothetical protein
MKELVHRIPLGLIAPHPPLVTNERAFSFCH